MKAGSEIAIGLDVGTGGARALAVDLSGSIVASGRADFDAGTSLAEGPRVEQDPAAWTRAAQVALRQVTGSLPSGCRTVGVSVDATSGTFLLADADNRPLTPGIMYNDLRGAVQAPRAAKALRDTLGPYGIEIAPAFALPKILHLLVENPELRRHSRRILHQTDWIVGMLCGRYDVTDISTALKTGADPGRLAWPAAMHEALAIPPEWLPRIVLPGERVGAVTLEAAALTGLPKGTPVVSGCTDGTAGFLASGAEASGDLNVTLGTTLVFKAVSDQPVIDPAGAVYNHRHPAGGFLPGAASSTGGEWVSAQVGSEEDLDELGRRAGLLLPTQRVVYPLVKTGERFPFACSAARGFGFESIESRVERFAAGMEGVAFLERLGIERFEALGLRIGESVYATGGGVKGDTWLRIRASACRRAYAVPEQPECAMGAVILAATPVVGDCGRAIRAMVRIQRTVEPDAALAEAYENECGRFKDELHRRGYL
jgi:sugar (pentulose or hexulose) kinase